MNVLLLLLLCFLVAGCTNRDGSSAVSSSSQNSSPEQTRTELLLDEHWNYTNQSPQPFAGENVVVAQFGVQRNFSALNITVTQVQRPAEAFADSVRVEGPGEASQEKTFSGGAAEFGFASPTQGTWTVSFGTDQLQPLGQHELRIQAWGTL